MGEAMKRAILITLLSLLDAATALLVWAAFDDYPVFTAILAAGAAALTVVAWLLAKKWPRAVNVLLAFSLLFLGALLFLSPAPKKYTEPSPVTAK